MRALLNECFYQIVEFDNFTYRSTISYWLWVLIFKLHYNLDQANTVHNNVGAAIFGTCIHSHMLPSPGSFLNMKILTTHDVQYYTLHDHLMY